MVNGYKSTFQLADHFKAGYQLESESHCDTAARPCNIDNCNRPVFYTLINEQGQQISLCLNHTDQLIREIEGLNESN